MEQRAENENLRRWRKVDGSWAERPVEKVQARKQTLFDIDAPLIALNDPSERVLDRLIGLCFSGPEYLSHDDAARYIALLHELKEFTCNIWQRVGQVQMKVENLPINRLGPAIAEWVESYFRDKRCALMPAYALDTAMFIKAHVSGHYEFESQHWEIKPLVEVGERDLFGFLDTSFKSHFTSNFGGTIVRCRIPESCAIRFQDRVLVGAGQEFCAVIKRCHLSTNFQDAIYLETDKPDEPGFRLDLGFWFVGEIAVVAEASLYQWFNDPKQYPIIPLLFPECGPLSDVFGRFDIAFPAGWVLAAAKTREPELLFTAVPCWDAEIGKHRSTEARNSFCNVASDTKMQ